MLVYNTKIATLAKAILEALIQEIIRGRAQGPPLLEIITHKGGD